MSSQGEDVCTTITARKLLRQRIEAGGFILAPGVHDGFSARIALETGAGVTASVHGCADLGIATLNDMRRSAEMIASLSPFTPVIADADTGYGGPIMVARTVEQYSRSGVGALHIEDQVQTKRCGHLAGKVLVDLKEYLARIRAAVQARRRIESDIVIIARTDSIQKHGYEEALAGSVLHAMLELMLLSLRVFVLLNMVENSVTPKISAKEAKGLGFSMMIVPLATLAPAYTAIKAGLQKLKETGLADTELTPQDLFRVCGLDESMKIDEEAGASNFEGGVD
ncbi:methylisocitrate lyase [Fusarium oxysporum f. sp. lycopersici 4287]|uniref:Methylisocitrate lyase n=1 Tax=Fusarium oxysporum f. sp. lycopersici (strain 4287 / CBS 123668 / FGSC 9935 / NRRL 34936) TaxID=426428 RepID=A0A0J9U5I4_FUSO4|nr:methylisocitrate lyase [Fusarium oxysporum f. sp. lycopersici 4287]KNA94438.1 methylisocitrate lyase [Fusarium oxysporum f. sp. lycopersici 4287]